MSNPKLDIGWDPVKAHVNAKKHGVDFAEAATVLLDPLALTVFDAAHSQVEERWLTLGLSASGRLLAVAHTYRFIGSDGALARIISAREATRTERRQYEQHPDR
jgi:hypothetical protein